MSKYHLDAGVLIALFDTEDAHNSKVLDELYGIQKTKGAFGLSALAYTEFLVGAIRSGRSAVERADRLLARLCPDGPVALDKQAAARAAKLRVEHAWLKSVDAAVLASSQTDKSKELLTTDKKLSRLPGVRYVGV
jgi:predicted nucleic acid-binding protein